MEEMIRLILNNDFEKAERIYWGNNERCFAVFGEALNNASNASDSIGIYFFILYLLHKKNDPKLHALAWEVLIGAYVYIPGAYQLAYNHIKDAIILEDTNVSYLEAMLFFYKNPDKRISSIEARSICSRILELSPQNSLAITIQKRLDS